MKASIHLVLAVAFATAFCRLTTPALSAPGDLDLTFGTGGKVIRSISDRPAGGRSVALQSDGKILVAGFWVNFLNKDTFELVRYTSTGALDIETTTSIGSDEDQGQSVAVQSDGKIVVAGTSYNGSNYDFALVRYNANGSLDTSFNGTGKVTTAIGSSNDFGRSVAGQSDGKILVAGVSVNGTIGEFALVRYTSTGGLDTTFNGTGKVTTPVGSGSAGYSVAVQSDGKILVAGVSATTGDGDDFTVVRYTSTGALDTTFNGTGMVTTPVGSGNDVGYSVALQSDGRILVAGSSSSSNGSDDDFALVRYTSTGALDVSFGEGTGKVTTPFGSYGDVGRSVAVQSNGRIVVAGTSDNGSNDDFALVRYTSTGVLDTSFGAAGKVTTDLGDDDFGYGVALQPDGKIVVAGTSRVDGYKVAVLRYEGDTITDPEISVEQPVGTALIDAVSSVTFAAGTIGSSTAKTFTIRNTGTTDLTGLVVTKEGLNSGEFTIGAVGSTTLAPGASTIFTVIFSPTSANTRTAFIHIASNDADESPFDVLLIGALSSTQQFPSTAAITIPNSGNATPYPSTINVSGVVQEVTAIRVNLNGLTHTYPEDMDIFLVAPNGAVCALMSDAGGGFALNNANLTFDDSAAVAIPYAGTIISGSYRPANYEASEPLPPGGTGTIGTSLVALSSGGANGDWKLFVRDDTGGDFGSIQSWAVVFETFGGQITPEITVDQPAGTSLSDGVGTRDFGSVAPGTSVVLTFTITNVGAADLTGLAVSKDVMDAAEFTIGPLAATTLTPGASTTFDVTFTPSTTGTRTATIHIASNDGDENPFDIALTGTGVSSPGQLDFTFGVGGKVTTPIGVSEVSLRSVAVQRDGKIVVGGTTSNGGDRDFVLIRYNSQGMLDTSFGTGGKVVTDFATDDDIAYSVVIQNDGKIVAAGQSGIGVQSRFSIVRYTSTGTVDTSFNGTGKVSNDYGVGYGVVIQNDGKIVCAGSDGNFAVVRYMNTGALDTSFNGTGRVSTDLGGSQDTGRSVAVQSDGKIVVAGDSVGNAYDFALVRYNADGTLDTSFNGTGKVTTDFGSTDDTGWSVALQSDGRIVVAGFSKDNTGNHFALARYNSNGTLDASFNGTGKITTDIGNENSWVTGVVVQSDGKIVVAGISDNGGRYDFALARYHSNGTLDTSFNGTGKVTTDFGNTHDRGFGLALQSDGKIVVVGESIGTGRVALARYHGDTPDQAFNNVLSAAGLTGPAADANATPFQDGVENLIKYAFNMNLAGPDAHTLPPGGNSGLPIGQLYEDGGQSYWQFEFVRRKTSGLTYTPQKSTTLNAGSFVPMTGAMIIQNLDAQLERVIVIEPWNPATDPKSFSRVEVTLP